MINLRRRSFLFGASAALVVPPVRTFHLMPKVPLELAVGIHVNTRTGMLYSITKIIPSAENGWCNSKITPLKWMVEV